MLGCSSHYTAYWRVQVPEALVEQVDVFHLPDIMGSDHCPIGLVLKGFSKGV